MRSSSGKINLRHFLNPVTIIVGLIFLVGLILAGMAVLFLGRSPVSSMPATPLITRIAAPTQTIVPMIPTATVTPTRAFGTHLPEGVIGTGVYVQVTGTQGAGLRMRSAAGLSGSVNFTALDSEVFLVVDGPIEADGYTWWLLEAPYDQTRTGWSASDFLAIIEEE